MSILLSPGSGSVVVFLGQRVGYSCLCFLLNGGPVLKGVLVSSVSVMLAQWDIITPCSVLCVLLHNYVVLHKCYVLWHNSESVVLLP